MGALVSFSFSSQLKLFVYFITGYRREISGIYYTIWMSLSKINFYQKVSTLEVVQFALITSTKTF